MTEPHSWGNGRVVIEEMRDVISEAISLQKTNYGNGTALHLAMIEWVAKAKKLLEDTESST